jgi:hypothetical protein
VDAQSRDRSDADDGDADHERQQRTGPARVPEAWAST